MNQLFLENALEEKDKTGFDLNDINDPNTASIVDRGSDFIHMTSDDFSWFGGEQYALMKTSQTKYDDHYMVAGQVQQLISTMAGFGASIHNDSMIPDQTPSLVLQDKMSVYGG